MIQKKKKRLYGGLILLSVIVIALVVMEICGKRKADLSPHAEQVLPSEIESNPSAEIETSGSNDQIEPNVALEFAQTTQSELDDPLFNEMVERDVRTSAYRMNQELWLKKHIESMRKTDKELTKKWDLPDDVLAETSTDKLLLHFVRSPLKVTVTLYSEDWIGVQRLLNASSTLYEFYMRGDLAEGALRMYREYDLSPEAMSDESIRAVFSRDKRIFEYPETKRLLAPDRITDTKITNICMNIWFADRIMLTKQLFPKLKGHEREFLSVMLDRYAQISELSKKYPGGSFGTAISCVPSFCRNLAKNIDEDFYARLQTIEPYTEEGRKQFIGEIERYLGK